MYKSESIKNIATALCEFQGAVEKIKKTATNPFFKSKYASLSDILDIIREPLSKNGLSFVQFPKGVHGLETMIMHVSGEWMCESYEMKPTKDDPQGSGSVITYQRRYALGAILGLNIDEDDDGNKASEPAKPKAEPKKEVKKPALTPSHPKWDDAIVWLKKDGTITALKERFEISPETETIIIDSL